MYGNYRLSRKITTLNPGGNEPGSLRDCFKAVLVFIFIFLVLFLKMDTAAAFDEERTIEEILKLDQKL